MEVLTVREMEKADQLAIASGTSGFALMLSAGRAVAEAAIELVERGPILVVAGSGNNGGDGEEGFLHDGTIHSDLNVCLFLSAFGASFFFIQHRPCCHCRRRVSVVP
jgi:hypothetical protein